MKYAYLVKRRKNTKDKYMRFYLGPVNNEILQELLEVVSKFMLHQTDKLDSERLSCPKCGTPISKMGIEGFIINKLQVSLRKMENSNEDIYDSEKYTMLKWITENLAKY